MFKFNTPKVYTLSTGGLLFLVGLLGFAFPEILEIPGPFLVFSLILGFWGVAVGIKKS